MTFTFRRAEPADLATVRSILESRVGWLHEQGYDQWSEQDPGRDTQRSVNNGDTWLLLENDRQLATLTMTTVADTDFWTAADLAQPALYLSKLATRPEAGARGLGALLVECANSYAGARGIPRLRWDVWRTNANLQAYYKRLGAKHVRTVEVPSRSSGALFEWAYRRPRVPAEVTIDAPTDVHAEVRSTVHYPPDLANDRSEEYQDPSPEHWHLVSDLQAPCLASPASSEPQKLWISGQPNRQGPLLYNPGTGWMAHEHWTHPATGSMLDLLQTGHPHRLSHVTDGGACRVVLLGDTGTA